MTQLTDKVWAVEVPEGYPVVIEGDILKVGEAKNVTYLTPPGSYRLLFTTKTATEEDARKVVEGIDSEGRGLIYMNYENGMYVFSRATSSLRSFLRSKRFDNNKNYALIEKQSSDD